MDALLHATFVTLVQRAPNDVDPVPGGLVAAQQAFRARLALTQHAFVRLAPGPDGIDHHIGGEGVHVSPLPPHPLEWFVLEDVGTPGAPTLRPDGAAAREYGEAGGSASACTVDSFY